MTHDIFQTSNEANAICDLAKKYADCCATMACNSTCGLLVCEPLQHAVQLELVSHLLTRLPPVICIIAPVQAQPTLLNHCVLNEPFSGLLNCRSWPQQTAHATLDVVGECEVLANGCAVQQHVRVELNVQEVLASAVNCHQVPWLRCAASRMRVAVLDCVAAARSP